MELKIPLLVLSGLALFTMVDNESNSKNKTNTATKFIPKEQPIFKTRLDYVLSNIEQEVKIDNIRDFLMGVAWVESKYYPSAIRYESIDKDRYTTIKKLFKTNPYINDLKMWSWTGGLFQLFPSSALKTLDGLAINNNPTTIFDPYYSIAYAIDFASRLNKLYSAHTYMDVRLGWHSLSLLKNKNPEIISEVEERIIKGIKASNGNVNILYDYNPNAFKTYRNKWGYKKLLDYILTLKKKN